MRLATEDRTARALIRDSALRLFAEHPPDRVTLRQIAAEAGVSHGLVVHHFGTKEGLRAVVDTLVVDVFDELLGELARESGEDPLAGEAGESLVAALLERLPANSPVPAYLRRLLLEGGDAGRALFQRLYALTRAALEAMAESGSVDRGEDPEVRAAFLLANDLAVLLLREQILLASGVDPLSVAGAPRWGREVLAVYRHGLRPRPDDGEKPEPR